MERVLVVDDNTESRISTANVFALRFSQVTMVDSAARAIETITTEKKPFDVIVADVDMPDADAFELCQQLNKLGVLVILTCAQEGLHLEKQALEIGAFVLIPKPVEESAVKIVHQFFMRERAERCKRELAANYPISRVPVTDEAPEGGDDDLCRKCRKKKSNQNEGGGDSNKLQIEWTDELHQKFLGAVAQLGQGRCFPSKILEIMNVPGLTRTQVSSHLQKCRNVSWKGQRRSQKMKTSSVSAATAKGKEKRQFGSLPQPQPENNTWSS